MMKLRLTIESGSLAGREFELEQGALVLGRAADVDIKFDFNLDPGVSSRHAVIRAEESHFRLVDERSTNGTLINGSVTKDSILQNGDMILLGSQGPQIRVTIEAERPEQQQTREFLPPELKTQYFAPPEIPSPPPLPPTPPPIPPVPPPPSQAAASPVDALRNTLSGLAPKGFRETKEGQRTIIGCVAGIIIGGFLMLIIMSLMIWQLGFAAAFVGSIMAFLPAPFYLFVIFWVDRYDPEPGWAVASAFAWGGLVAILVSFIMNTMFGTAMGGIAGAEQGDTLSAIISAPLFEEGSKGLGVVLLLIFVRKEFDGIVDGIFYAAVIALGFSTFENILYYGGQFYRGGFGAMISNVFDRGVLAPFSHALFTSMTGLGCGVSRETHNKAIRWLAPAAGYVLAMILHGFWNAIASALVGVGYYIAYFMVWVPLFLIFVGGIIAVVRREQKIILRMLSLQIGQDLITPEQLSIVTSLFKRTSWLLSSLNDLKRFNARRRFLRYTTKLAFSYWHMEVAAKDNSSTISTPMAVKYQSELRQLKLLV